MATETAPRVQPLVLVIDDSITYRTAIAQALKQAGYAVVAAASGEEGLRAATRLRPDVVVVDWMLPDVDGTAIIRTIRLEPALRRIPCLLITADEDPSVEFTALETGADAYVRKGDDLNVLLARVAALRRDAPEVLTTPTPQRRRVMLMTSADAPTSTGMVRRFITGRRSRRQLNNGPTPTSSASSSASGPATALK